MAAPASASPNETTRLHLTQSSPEEAAPPTRRRLVLPLRTPAALPPLLLLLAVAPLLLLSLAVWQSVQNAAMARDINRSGGLRYQAMWLYGATSAAAPQEDPAKWRDEWNQMRMVHADLARRYPGDTAQMNKTWRVFARSLQNENRVDWRDASNVSNAARRLTDALDEKVQNNAANVRLLYTAGIVSLCLSLPWSYFLAQQLRRTQTVLQGHQTALADASIRYDQLFEGLPSACFGYDMQGRIVTWNRASEELFGKSAAEVLHKPLWEVISRPENWERNQRIVRDVLAGVPYPDLEWAYQTPSGTNKDVVSTIFPLYGASGIVGGISANGDITERKRASEALQALTAELQRSNRELAAFASVASHDLKEPLRKIESFGGLLQRKAGPTLDPDNADYLNRMISAARRMSVLIDGLLEYGRVSSKPRLLQSVDLNRIVSEVIDDLEARIASADAQMEIGPLPHVWGDALQMRQLLQNLLGNALKFHAPGAAQRPHVRVWSEAGDTPGTARLFVADNGIGFEAQHAERIFDVFERLDGASRTYEGSGVGLAICRKIAAQHGGTISAKSQPGKGATFAVVLPTAA